MKKYYIQMVEHKTFLLNGKHSPDDTILLYTAEAEGIFDAMKYARQAHPNLIIETAVEAKD